MDAERNECVKRDDDARDNFQDPWLKATCEQLFHTSPRELRVIIYGDIMNSTCIQLDGSENSSDPGGLGWMLEDYHYEIECHFHKENLVGRNVFRELVQVFYQKHTFLTRSSRKGTCMTFCRATSGA